jgi:hypothetical protein
MKPHRLELDYIATARRPVWPGLVVLALSLALAMHLVIRYRDARLELAGLQAAASLVGPERRPARAVPKERLDEEAKSAEAVVRQLTVPWGSLIQALEQAASRDVAVLQLQPDAENRVVRLGAQARNAEAMFAYLRRLGAAKGLADVHMLSHQLQREDPQRPVQFSVQASLKAAQ